MRRLRAVRPCRPTLQKRERQRARRHSMSGAQARRAPGSSGEHADSTPGCIVSPRRYTSELDEYVYNQQASCCKIRYTAIPDLYFTLLR
jgi:hypothetical protein